MSTSSALDQDTVLHSFDVFGVEVDFTELASWNESERVAYFESLYNTHQLDEDAIEDFESSLNEELEEFYDRCYNLHKDLNAIYNSGNAVIHPVGYRAVMEQCKICHISQGRAGLFIFNNLWHVGNVATGHHQRFIKLFEQNMMQGGVGQHEAELV